MGPAPGLHAIGAAVAAEALAGGGLARTGGLGGMARTGSHQPAELTESFMTFDPLKIKTLRAPMVIFSPVLGFRPTLARLLFTVHFPNPEIMTGFPVDNSSLMIAKRLSTTAMPSFFVKPTSSQMLSTSVLFVSAMGFLLFGMWRSGLTG
jgi:hypothetical protein